MKLKTLYSVTLACFLHFLPYTMWAQKQELKIRLDTVKTLKGIGIGQIDVMQNEKEWCVGGIPDSILWSFPFQSHRANSDNCKTLFSSLNVLVRKKSEDSVQICIFKRYNTFLKDEIVLSYSSDSLKSWTKKDYPDKAVPRISMTLPYCINNKDTSVSWEFYFFPFNIGFTSDDKCLNQMPLAVAMGKMRVVKLASSFITLFKYSCTDGDNAIKMSVRENGIPHRDLISNNLKFKSIYALSDTLIIDNNYYKVDSVDANWEYVYIRPLEVKKQSAILPEKYIKELAPYFKGSDTYLLVDYWGTWCGPCIAAMPEMRKLYNRVKKNVSFLSICFDVPDNYAKATKIFSTHKLGWPQMFCNMKDNRNTIVSDLSVATFPTYMLVKRDGEVIFRDSSEGFEELSKILLNKNSRN